MSSSLNRVDWHNSKLVRGDVAKEIAELKHRYGKEIQVWGSGGLAQTLMKQDLIDEYRLLIYPVVLGTGKRLFGAGTVPCALQLLETKTTSTGVMINTYRPSGKPTYGSFAVEE